jgi:hypothetical protein
MQTDKSCSVTGARHPQFTLAPKIGEKLFESLVANYQPRPGTAEFVTTVKGCVIY